MWQTGTQGTSGRVGVIVTSVSAEEDIRFRGSGWNGTDASLT